MVLIGDALDLDKLDGDDLAGGEVGGANHEPKGACIEEALFAVPRVALQGVLLRFLGRHRGWETLR